MGQGLTCILKVEIFQRSNIMIQYLNVRNCVFDNFENGTVYRIMIILRYEKEYENRLRFGINNGVWNVKKMII